MINVETIQWAPVVVVKHPNWASEIEWIVMEQDRGTASSKASASSLNTSTYDGHSVPSENDNDTSDSVTSAVDRTAQSRLAAEERRARHREAQRQFAIRKKYQVDEMRQEMHTLELHHQILSLRQEAIQLQREYDKLHRQYEALDSIRFGDEESKREPSK